MRRCVSLCFTLAFCAAGAAYAKLPPPSEEERAKAALAVAKASEGAKKEAEALARAQDRVVEFYRRSKSGAAAAPDAATNGEKRPIRAKTARKVETLACLTGSEDRHARIGVELIDDKVDYFAYYSKWKPRTCSIEVKRGGPYSRWEDNGAMSKVTLVEGKGVFLIDRKGGAYRFTFRNVDRGRYCGMDGKINGSLVVTRGKRECGVQGVMDGHAG